MLPAAPAILAFSAAGSEVRVGDQDQEGAHVGELLGPGMVGFWGACLGSLYRVTALPSSLGRGDLPPW